MTPFDNKSSRSQQILTSYGTAQSESQAPSASVGLHFMWPVGNLRLETELKLQFTEGDRKRPLEASAPVLRYI